MTVPRCASPIDYLELIGYWFGELSTDAENRLEEHLFGCADCTSRLDKLVALREGIRSAFMDGLVQAVISEPILARMKEEGLRLREYAVPPGGTVNCTISDTDDAVIGRFQASLTAVRRLDLVRVNEQGEFRHRLPDVPFDPIAGEVLYCPSAAALKKMPAHTDRFQLLAVDEAGERLVAEYTFIHSPA